MRARKASFPLSPASRVNSASIPSLFALTAEDALKGDLLCLAGALLYGICNVAQEYLVKQRPSYEYLGMVGFWASIISGIQM